jgi:2-phospho-L-lactate/phosphoenolpyruvate guanylyltransferase
MPTLAILPIKSFEDAKQRLGPELSAGPRRALAEAMFSDTLVALRRATLVDQVLVVTADNTAQQIAGGHGTLVLDDLGEGHSEAAVLGIERALELGFEQVLLVPGDCPTLDPTELDELLGTAREAPAVVVVPDRHGTGTNALLLTPPNAFGPAFGPGSRDRHVTNARLAGAAVEVAEVPSLALDIDTPDDLAVLSATLSGSHGGAAHTRGMLSQLLRSRS